MDHVIRKTFLLIFLLVILSACTASPAPIQPTQTEPALLPTLAPTISSECEPRPIVKPTMPAEIPGYAQLDTSTGLHITGTAQDIDLADYQLKVTGKVDHPMTLTYDELRCLPKMTAKPVLICKGYFEDIANWSGASLKYILDQAVIQDDAKSVFLVGGDGYQAYLNIEEATREDNFLAYEWEGQPLPILHGFPVRAVMPSMLGNKWIKWLIEIRVE